MKHRVHPLRSLENTLSSTLAETGSIWLTRKAQGGEWERKLTPAITVAFPSQPTSAGSLWSWAIRARGIFCTPLSVGASAFPKQSCKEGQHPDPKLIPPHHFMPMPLGPNAPSRFPLHSSLMDGTRDLMIPHEFFIAVTLLHFLGNDSRLHLTDGETASITGKLSPCTPNISI